VLQLALEWAEHVYSVLQSVLRLGETGAQLETRLAYGSVSWLVKSDLP
jgi:hypothetical protein